jgi:hypothetical protein
VTSNRNMCDKVRKRSTVDDRLLVERDMNHVGKMRIINWKNAAAENMRDYFIDV